MILYYLVLAICPKFILPFTYALVFFQFPNLCKIPCCNGAFNYDFLSSLNALPEFAWLTHSLRIGLNVISLISQNKVKRLHTLLNALIQSCTSLFKVLCLYHAHLPPPLIYKLQECTHDAYIVIIQFPEPNTVSDTQKANGMFVD